MLTSYEWLSAHIHVFEGEPADVRRADADRQRRMLEPLARSAVFDQPGRALLVFGTRCVAFHACFSRFLRGYIGTSWRGAHHHRDAAPRPPEPPHRPPRVPSCRAFPQDQRRVGAPRRIWRVQRCHQPSQYVPLFISPTIPPQTLAHSGISYLAVPQ